MSPNSSEYHERYHEKVTVLLTGSTGSLGSYLLDALLGSPGVERVICANRSSDAAERQRASMDSRVLREIPGDIVSFIQTDLSLPTFGLSQTEYERLQACVTCILHNAWPVDFNLPLSSFEPSIRGVRHLINLATTCTRGCQIMFVSSISVAATWGAVPGSSKSVPEVVLDDWRLARTGYGQSKLVSELVLAEAAASYDTSVSLCRVGQVGGPVERGLGGSWKGTEWVPALIASSHALGKVPATLGPMNNVDWVPVDKVASVLVELVLSERDVREGSASRHIRFRMRKATAPRVFHITNPVATPWPDLLPAVLAKLGSTAEVIPFSAWVDALRSSAESGQTVTGNNSAIKLLNFFESLQDKAVRFPRATAAEFETVDSKRLSPTLASLGPVNYGWMLAWLRQWTEHGLFEQQ